MSATASEQEMARFWNLRAVQHLVEEMEDLQRDAHLHSDDVHALLAVLVDQTKRLGRMMDAERITT